nr:hypothetical protein [uncultured Flavobacterium sp.]
MKTNKEEKTNKKFDLEKMNVVKLKKLQSINGGDLAIYGGDDKTVTDLSSNCGNDRKA